MPSLPQTTLRRPVAPLAGLLIGALLVGCAQWAEMPVEPPKLPPVRLAPDSVALEICFVQLSQRDAAAAEQIWQQADEQQLPAEVRHHLQSNGFRCGTFGVQMPGELRDLLGRAESDKGERKAKALEDAAPVDDLTGVTRRVLHSRNGHRSEIVASDVYDTLNVLLREDEQLRGQTCENAQCLWAVKSFPLGDGRVRLELTPEVHYGQPEQSWTVDHGVFRQQVGRRRKTLLPMRIETVLSPGQTLALGANPELEGSLGRRFFTSEAGGKSRDKLLLLRLAQTQHDDLFAPERIATPIATFGE